MIIEKYKIKGYNICEEMLMRDKIFNISLLLLLTISTGCSHNSHDNDLSVLERNVIFGKNLGKVENCDNLVLYFIDNDTDTSYYTKCVKGISVTYSDTKLDDDLKDAIHDKRTSLEQMKKSAREYKNMDNRTIYKYVNFNMSVCKKNKNVIFSISSDMNDYCS